MDWKCGPRGRVPALGVPALQALSPEFKLQPHPKASGTRSGSVPHTYNPSYLGGRDWADCGLRPAQEKDLISTNKLCMVVHV
jgi:hypothetical protein